MNDPVLTVPQSILKTTQAIITANTEHSYHINGVGVTLRNCIALDGFQGEQVLLLVVM